MYLGDGNQFSQPDPTIKEFADMFATYSSEITNDGKKLVAHDIPAIVTVDCIGSDKMYQIVGMSVGMLGGCRCWANICIEIEEIKE